MLLGEDRTKSREGIGESPLVLTRVVVLILRARREEDLGGVERSIFDVVFFGKGLIFFRIWKFIN